MSFLDKARPVSIEDTQLSPDVSNLSFASKVRPVVQEPGFFKGVARDIVKPFARLGTNVVQAGQIALGQERTQPFSNNFLGEVKPVGQEGTFGERLKDTVGVGLQVASNIPVAKGAGLTYQGLKTAVQSKRLLPVLGKATLPLVKEGAFGGGSYVAGKALEDQKSIPRALGESALGAVGGAVTAPVLGLGLPLATRGLKNIPKLKSALTPEAPNIMNRVARLNPSDAQKFEKLAKKSHGQYLVDTGNFGTPQEIVLNEAKKFTDSMREVDVALDMLPGRFKTKPLDDVLEDLVDRERQIGVPDSDSNILGTLYRKNKEGGLSMSESNWVKRKYERDVKLGYQKEQNTIGIARATRLDDALRGWQFKTASEMGLKNLPDLNKQTQLSKFIVDKLGKQISGKTGNDAVSLTDWVILSGGDPTAITAFFLKKGILNRGFQAEIARMLTKNPPTGALKSEFGGDRGFLLPSPAKGSNPFSSLSMRGPKPPTSFEPPSQKINRSSSLLEILQLSAPKSNAQGKPIILPRSIRETNLGLDEVKNTNRSQTNRKAQLPLELLPKQLKKSLPPTIPHSQPKRNVPLLPKKKSLKDKLKDIPGMQGGYAQIYKGEKDLTTKILKDLEGKTTVSKQYILDATNRGELKQIERDIVREILKGEGNTVNVADFAKKVKAELLPLEPTTKPFARYENIALPSETRGKVKNYSERIYRSPIETSAGDVHFDGEPRYFGHTRIEDMADNKTRRVIEVQSDLYQKGRLEHELNNVKMDLENPSIQNPGNSKALADMKTRADKRFPELSKLSAYNDPTAHFRMVREEIKKAAQDGKTKLQFPTGETAMKIEGLGDNSDWRMAGANGAKLDEQRLVIGQEVVDNRNRNQSWIITDVLGDGKFKAVPTDAGEGMFRGPDDFADYIKENNTLPSGMGHLEETFDISGKVDTDNPIYRFYEKEVQKYLTKFGGKRVVDDRGVSWIEVPIKKEYGKQAVDAFGKVMLNPLFIGAGISTAAVGATQLKEKKKVPFLPSKRKK